MTGPFSVHALHAQAVPSIIAAAAFADIRVVYKNWVWRLGRHRVGYSHDLVYEDEQPYLERWILWFGLTLRVHKFRKGDDERAFHDHPWWFVTVPLKPYMESTPDGRHTVLRRFLPQFRSAKHRHIVRLIDGGPVWTLILTGPKSKEWGFWERDMFTHHSQWIGTDESL